MFAHAEFGGASLRTFSKHPRTSKTLTGAAFHASGALDLEQRYWATSGILLNDRCYVTLLHAQGNHSAPGVSSM